MRDNFTIIKEDFNEETGVTTVTINTNYGLYVGKTTIDEIDKNYPSVFQGAAIALAKAQRKWAKAMIMICREKVLLLKRIISQFKNTPNAQFGSHEAQRVFGHLEEEEKELALWKKRKEVLDKQIKDRVAARDKLVKAYLDKKN